MMFKRIIDNSNSCSATHSHAQFIHFFGINCLSKIKNIEAKFNQVQQQILKTPFDIIALKVKTMLDCYQVIAHQIYGAFQSINLHSLGHSIVKMFLQISSAIKWLIKSFTISYTKSGTHKILIENKENLQDQGDKFRKRQINRYMRKGAIQEFESDEEQKFRGNIYSCFGQSKQNFQKSKNKALAVNSSNLPLILEDTVQYLTKKSEYIEKFIALRQNYEGSHRFELLTSQAILQSDGQKSAYAAANDKFKHILNKLQAIQNKKVTVTLQNGTQTSNIACEKSKRVNNTERNKIKTLVQDVERQKAVNKQLQLKIEMYEKKISLIKHNEDGEVVRDKISIFKGAKRRTNRYQTNSQKPENLLNYDDYPNENQHQAENERDKIQNKQEQSENVGTLIRKPKINVKNRTHRVQSGFIRPLYINESQENSLLYEKRSNQQIKYPALTFTSHVIDLQVALSSKNANSNVCHERILNFNSNIYDINLRGYQTKKKISKSREHTLQRFQLDEASKKLLYARISPIESSSSHFNSPISIKNIEPTCKTKQKVSQNTELKHHNRRNNKVQTSMNFAKKSLNFQEFKLDNLNKQKTLKQQVVDLISNFPQHQILTPLKNLNFDKQTLLQFFIDETNAKNYELLNVAEICGIQKKIKASGKNSRVVSKRGSHSTKIFSRQSVQYKTASLNLISKKIYNQIIKTRRSNKDAFLSIILFLRYPFSFLSRTAQIRMKLNQQQELIFDQYQLQCLLKRIWSMHHSCQVLNQNSQIMLCPHKVFILNFFGIAYGAQKQEKTSDTTQRK